MVARERAALSVLTLGLDDREVARLLRHPASFQIALELESDAPVLWLDDAFGRQHRHDLRRSVADGFRWLHLELDLEADLSCRIGAILSRDDGPPQAAFRRGEVPGVRFQPPYLAGDEIDPARRAGRGLRARGFVEPGRLTPGNVSFACICDHCRASFQVQGFHAELLGVDWLHCAGGNHTLIVPRAGAQAQPGAGLPPCRACGGGFDAAHPFRCPSCRAPYVDFTRHPDERAREWYGLYLLGDAPQMYAA